MSETTTPQKIEAILFWKAEPVSRSFLKEILAIDDDTLTQSLAELNSSLTNRGLAVISANDTYELVTSPSVSAVIEGLHKDELTRDLGKAGLETLTIVLYLGPITRKEIEYLRGVNSQFVLRNLLIRGLIEKEVGKGLRLTQYSGTLEALKHLGVQTREELPEFEKMTSEYSSFRSQPEAVDQVVE